MGVPLKTLAIVFAAATAIVTAPGAVSAVQTAQATPRVQLPGDVTVELPAIAGGHGVVDIEIPRDVTYSLATDNSNFQIDTEADFAAVVLVEDRLNDSQVVFAGRADPDLFCPEGFDECQDLTSGTLVRQRRLDETATGDPFIAAGRYRLHVVTDGPAATVTLRFTELGGSAQLTATTAPIDSATVATPGNDATAPAPGFHTASSEKALNGKGMAWTLYGVTGNLGLFGQYGICTWAGGLPESGLHRQPGCLTAATASRSERVEASTESEVFMDFALTGIEPGLVGFSSYFAGTTPVTQAGTVTMYLQY